MKKILNLSNINSVTKVISSIVLTTIHIVSNTVCSRLVLLLFSLLLMLSEDYKFEFKKIKFILFPVIASFLSSVFYVEGNVLFSIGSFHMTDMAIHRTLMMSISMITFYLISLILIRTIPPNDISYVAEFFLKPFEKFNLNVSEICIVMSLVMRFIPVVFDETKKIIKAQESRGAKLLNGPVMKRLKYLTPVFIPIFMSCLRRAINIATAMECRCYGAPFTRTRLKESKFTRNDILAFFIVFLICCGVLACNLVKIF